MSAGTYATDNLSAVSAGKAIPVNLHGTGNIPIGIVLDFATGTFVGTCSAQFTLDDPSSATAVWFDFPDLSGKTAYASSFEQMPCQAVRLNVTARTSGTAWLRVLQGIL